MAEREHLRTNTAGTTPLRRFPAVKMAQRVGRLFGAAAFTAALVGLAAPANAEPNDPYVYVAQASDATFVEALDRLGLGHLDDAEAVNTAQAACRYIQEGHSTREAVDGVRNTYPGMPLLRSAHFVAVARAIYCPDHAER